MLMKSQKIDAFFAYLRERERIRIKKEDFEQTAPWTADEILHQFRFCNVFREDDRTTRWFREMLRDPLKDSPEVLLTTIIFRWFNRIETGEVLLDRMKSPLRWNAAEARARLVEKGPPYVTGSYIIKTPNGMNKLDGVLWCIAQIPNTLGHMILSNPNRTLRSVWDELRRFPYLGNFMAYEIVTDLRYTIFLEDAPDKMTWANPGPGAVRGMERIEDGDVGMLNRMSPSVAHRVNDQMQELLAMAPDKLEFGDRFEMREIEHGLCEFDKYERARLGEGKPRQVYQHAL